MLLMPVAMICVGAVVPPPAPGGPPKPAGKMKKLVLRKLCANCPVSVKEGYTLPHASLTLCPDFSCSNFATFNSRLYSKATDSASLSERRRTCASAVLKSRHSIITWSNPRFIAKLQINLLKNFYETPLLNRLCLTFAPYLSMHGRSDVKMTHG